MDFKKICKLPSDGNYILFNDIYSKNLNDEKTKDVITLIFKNLDTGEKIIREIKNPEMEVYVAKPEALLGDYNNIDIDIEQVELHDVKYNDILRETAKLIGKEDYFWKCIRERRFEDLNRIKESNKLFSSDRNIEDFYKFKSLHYFGEKELTNTTKGFYDIEADIALGSIDFKNGTGTAPINAITMIDDSKGICYTVLLRNPDNPLIQELEDDIVNFKEFLHDMFDNDFGVLEYKIAFFDDEVELIKALFGIIHTLKLDFMLAWNQSFDIAYMISRLIKAGINPADVMCHPDFNFKECKYMPDKKNFEIKKKTDIVKLSSYSVFMDQMINYASIRKSQSQLDSFKLDYIGELETGHGKLDYSNITTKLRELPYKNYRLFVAYNIRDVLVQRSIEQKTNDIGVIFYRAYTSNTRYNKIFKEITFLTNVAFDDFLAMGIVLGNNINALKYNNNKEEYNALIDFDTGEEDDVKSVVKAKKKFRGAIVGSPLLILANGICLIGDRKSRSLYRFVVDFDYGGLYPTILELFNIYKSTMIGKIKRTGPISEKEKFLADSDSENDVEYDSGSKFIEDITTNEAILLGERYMHLPTPTELFDILEKELNDDEKKKIIYISKKKKKIILEIRKVKHGDKTTK